MGVIYVNAGHHLRDSGSSKNGQFESKLAMSLRDKVVDLLGNTTPVKFVPDHLNLRESIRWVNDRVDEDDLAFSIHFNSHRNSLVRGTEVYYSNERENELAVTFAEEVSKAGGFKNRGAKHDSQTWIGSLGWLRKIDCDSVLVEVCYLISEADMRIYNEDKVAQGFTNAVREVLKQQKELPEIVQQKLTLLVLLRRLVELLKKQRDLIIKQNT